MGLYWEPCPGGARLLRLLGDTPCPAVPGTIEGLPVAELGPYCFADRPVRPGARLHGNPEEEIRRVLARDAVAAALTNQKVQRFLLDHAAVTSIVEKE